MKKFWIFLPLLLVWFLSTHDQKQSQPTSISVFKPQRALIPKKNTQKVNLAKPKDWKIQEYHQTETKKFESPLGKTTVYSFSQNGIPILGMSIRLRELPDGTMVEEENTYFPISEVSIQKNQLEERAAELRAHQGRYDLSSVSADSLVILVRNGTKEGELSFAATAIDKLGDGSPTHLVIRSDDGKILHKSFGRKEF